MKQLGLFGDVKQDIEPEVKEEPEVEIKPSNGLVLRGYQQECVQNAFKLFKTHPGVLARMSTGSGKTPTVAEIVKQWLSQGADYRVLAMSHEQQGVNQLASEFEQFLGYAPAIEMGNRHVDTSTGAPLVTVASRASLYIDAAEADGELIAVSRLYKFKPKAYNWLLVIDEAHFYARKLKICGPIFDWFEQNPKSKRIGLTATPERGDGVSLRGLFPGVAIDYPMWSIDKPCSIKDGWTVPFDQRFIVVDQVEFDNLSKTSKEFTDDELSDLLGETRQLKKLVDPMLDLVGKRLTLVFNPSRAMAKDVCHQINADIDAAEASGEELKGIWGRAIWLDGTSPTARRELVYQQFKARKFQFLCVCGLCLQGYNNPELEAVAIFRPTKERSLAEQMKGRVARPVHGLLHGTGEETKEYRRTLIATSRKPNGMVIDLCGISGLPTTGTTAHLLAEGLPDEVAYKANLKMIQAQKELRDLTVDKAVEEAEKEYTIAQAIERQREEEEALRKRARDRSNLGGKTSYTARKVDQGRGGGYKDTKVKGDRITDKQLSLITGRGLAANKTMSKREAGRLIGMLMKGVPVRIIETKYPAQKYSQQPIGGNRLLSFGPDPSESISDIFDTLRNG